MSRAARVILTAVLAVTASAPVSAAAPPDRMNYQGVLRDAAGNPQDGLFSMEFRFFDAATGGTLLLHDLHPAVAVAGGLFNVELGESPQAGPPYASLSPMFRDSGVAFMEIQVGAEVLSPRIPIRSAAYALNADHLDGLNSIDFGIRAGANSWTGANAFSSAGNSFTGSGAGLTGVNADRVDGRDAAEFPLLAASNTFKVGNQMVMTGASFTKGLIVQGSPSQVAALQEWQSSTGSVLASVSAAGVFSGSGSGLTNVNASTLDGLDGAQLLRSDASDSFTAGTLTLNAGTTLDVKGSLLANGSLRMDGDGPDGDQSIFFYEAGSPTGRALTWDDAENRLEWNDSVALAGTLRTGGTAAASTGYSVIGTGTASATGFITGVNDLLVTDDLQVASSLIVNTEIRMNEDGPDGNQVIRFYEGGSPAGEAIFWDDSENAFELSDDVRVGGNNLYLNTAQITNASTSINFWSSTQGLFETVRWDDAATVFRLSDTTVTGGNHTVSGDLFVTGTKNFVQNHPHRPDLSVVYTALEGDESGTYTRGTARLAGGVARVRLGETFAWVTHPDVGLTAHLTPRGAPADLFVDSLTTEELVVRGGPVTAPDQVFDYVVMGLRIGFELHPVVQPRTHESPVPPREYWERARAARPDVAPHAPLDRFRGMMGAAGLPVPEESDAAAALRRGIGEADPRAARATEGSSSAAPEPSTPPAPANAVASEGDGPGAGDAGEPRGFVRGAQAGPAAIPAPGLLLLTLSESAGPGDLIALDPDRPDAFRRSSQPADPGVVGIVAGEPLLEDGDLRAPVATTGIVTARAEAFDASIAPGDLLVASAVAGHVARAVAAAPGTVVGKALEGLEAGTGSIRILVMLR